MKFYFIGKLFLLVVAEIVLTAYSKILYDFLDWLYQQPQTSQNDLVFVATVMLLAFIMVIDTLIKICSAIEQIYYNN